MPLRPGRGLAGDPKGPAALNEAQRCLELSPGYAGALNLIGNIETDLGEMDKALLAYRDAVRISPMYANAHFNWASPWLDRPRQGGRAVLSRGDPPQSDEADACDACGLPERQGARRKPAGPPPRPKNLESLARALPGKRKPKPAREAEAWHKDTSERN